MAYFECIIGNGGAAGIPLTVNCDSAFAGLTITATDGTTTLTQQCPSTSPYTVEFELPNGGSWDISGTIGGTPFTETILIQPFEVDLLPYINLSVDFYSAANDTVSYTGIDGQTHTITTDSNGHASATITIDYAGSSLTFTSTVAKNPSNLSQAYSKTISLTIATTSIYVMPVNDAMYWYGFKGSNFQECNTANGWSDGSISPTYNTNSLNYSMSTGQTAGIGTKNTVTATKAKEIYKVNSMSGQYATADLSYGLSKNWSNNIDAVVTLNTALSLAELNISGNCYIHTEFYNQINYDVYALWYE